MHQAYPYPYPLHSSLLGLSSDPWLPDFRDFQLLSNGYQTLSPLSYSSTCDIATATDPDEISPPTEMLPNSCTPPKPARASPPRLRPDPTPAAAFFDVCGRSIRLRPQTYVDRAATLRNQTATSQTATPTSLPSSQESMQPANEVRLSLPFRPLNKKKKINALSQKKTNRNHR